MTILTPVTRESLRQEQRRHWSRFLRRHPNVYGDTPSTVALQAQRAWESAGIQRIVELGAGHGRDTIPFAAAGLDVVAIDFAAGTADVIHRRAHAAGVADRVTVIEHDLAGGIPLDNASVDGCFAHMLLCMALTSTELLHLVDEIHRVVRPGGIVAYSVRTTADAHHGTGRYRGDGLWEHGGFVVRFFDRSLVDNLARARFDILTVTDHEEGDLPRRLWAVTMRRR